jgi:hypothetical protein
VVIVIDIVEPVSGEQRARERRAVVRASVPTAASSSSSARQPPHRSHRFDLPVAVRPVGDRRANQTPTTPDTGRP